MRFRRLIQKRTYFYDRDVYGFRGTRPIEPVEYTPEELQNRNQNANLLRLVYAYRAHGHRAAQLDPLNMAPQETVHELDPSRYGIKTEGESYNLQGIIHVGKSSDPSVSREKASIETILKHLQASYANRIGFEFAHIPNAPERRWFAQLAESFHKPKFSEDEKKYFFSLLSKSEVFDHFMAKKFPQVKRYGLEGGESMMIVLYQLFREASLAGVQDAIVCMPHRGRLNLLTDILKYSPAALFSKVKGNSEFPDGLPASGDVLSHLAISTDLDFGGPEKLHVSMLHNPSHLEAANPVALGKARARQMDLYEKGKETNCFLGDKVVCVQLHGDSAFTGQGVVTETLGLSNLPHFTAGGSVHVIVNNQIGYTTPAMNARSTVYTSDVGKMINAPVIHVNADFPEDVAYAANLAYQYRNKFRKDVIIDLICYRRMGHNELDEPAFTQPQMYKKIRSTASVPKKYEEKIQKEAILSADQIKAFREQYFSHLEQQLEASYSYKPDVEAFKGKWSGMIPTTKAVTKPDTGVDVDVLKQVGLASVATPENFKVHPRIGKYHIENRVQKVNSGTKLDWATAEALAFGSLLSEGYHVRISGQDVGRGTFSQRHAMLVDNETERTIIPLNRFTAGDKKHGKLEIANSHLSEFAVLGFEYGQSWESPDKLCIWEAQFGDFFNGAQIVIDVYLSSGEAKWMRQSGLVMLLPHGYDGAGPEHSSCRVERFLQLCDHRFDVTDLEKDDNPNMHVVNPTTPAQYFHLLRRQMHRNYRKPLIVVGPKVLLRHPQATSDLSEMQPGTTFQPVLSDPLFSNGGDPKAVCFVSGKLYYDLIKERQARGMDEQVAFVRLEELNPFPTKDLVTEIQKFKNCKQFFWIQEEPQNQGAYTFVEPRLRQLVPSLVYHGRDALAAPATGISTTYKKEQAYVVKGVFDRIK
ncbi:thiamine diphosphate-binding protein [Gorgonomyces haynaldii]|nr:thiamine diphosphate-binding protein [Gorgonomyces haynaldii]